MSIRGVHHTTRSVLAEKQKTIVRVGVVVGLLVLAIAMGRFIGRGSVDPEMLLAVTVAPIGLLAFFRLGRFEYGILTVMLTAGLLNFFTLPTGTESRIVLSLLVTMGLVAAWILQPLVVDKRFRLKSSPINKPLLAFVAISMVAYIWSNLFRDSLVFVWRSFPVVQIAALAVNILLPVLALLISNKIQEVKWLKWLAWLMVGMGAFVVVSILFGLPTDVFFWNGSSGLFAMWVVALAYALALFDDKLDRRIRALLLLLVVAWLFRNFAQARIWVSGWLPLGIACIVITFMRSKKLFAVAALAGLIYLNANFDYFYSEIVVANREEGGEQRLGLWEINLGHVANHPIFGMGPAGYAVYNMTYNPQDARSTHNNFFDILAQTGVIGFGVFLWLFASFLRIGTQTRRALAGRRNFEEAFAAACLAGCLAALAAMMLGDWVIPFAYNSTISGFDHSSFTWIFLGGMGSLYHIIQRRSSNTGDAFLAR